MAQVGWRVFSSIAMELDIALLAVRDYAMGSKMPHDFVDLLRTISPDWLEQMPANLWQGECHSPLESMAFLSGVLSVEDYSRATMPMRELTLETALERLSVEVAPLGVQIDNSLPVEQRLPALAESSSQALIQSIGMTSSESQFMAQRFRTEVAAIYLLLTNDIQRRQFWHWLDRFYFEFYYPWRQSRQTYMQQRVNIAETALGTLSNDNAAPPLDWLPVQNLILRMPELKQAALSGQYQIHFWVEPFGLADSFSIYPGKICISFSEPGTFYENFLTFADNIALRTKALADPTRLTILRMIRHFGMVNTEIANYLGISRPTVSIHAKILREAGLIRSEQVGREMRHILVQPELEQLFRDLEDFLDLPDSERRQR